MASRGSITTLTQALASTATVRLASLHKLAVFYTPLEERFERLSRLGARAMGTRVAGVSLVADERQWFKSLVGWRCTEQPLADSLCQAVVASGGPVIVPDTRADERFATLPQVVDKPHFRFYAGYPIKDGEQRLIGTFCALDTKPKAELHGLDGVLADLGQLVERELLTTDLWAAQGQLVSKLGEARRQALLDTLTRVWNRRGASELLDLLLERIPQTGECFAVLMIDVDEFKRINDDRGHAVGDQVLRQVAGSIVGSVRPDDIVARYAGDEFLVILRNADRRIAGPVAQRIRNNLEQAPLMLRSGRVPVTLSIGMAFCEPAEALTQAAIIERADRALMIAKRSGRNRVATWPDDTREKHPA